MASSIRNLMIRLGVQYDETGTNRLSKGLDNVAKRIERTSSALDKMRLPAVAAGLASAAGGASAFAAALVPVAASAVALPAAFAVSKAAAGTLKVAMTGVGDAMSAVAEGDAKKLDEALKNLSPNARAFVKASSGFTKGFEPIRMAVQDRLFEGLGKQIGPLSNNLLPTAKTGMIGVAGAFNSGAKEAAKFGATPIAKGALNVVFQTTRDVIAQASTAVQPFLGAMARLVILGAPLTKQMASWAINGVKAGAGFVNSAEGVSKIHLWVSRATEVLSKLGNIAKNVGVGLFNTFAQANKGGGDYLGTLERMTAKFAAWSKSVEGQQEAANVFKLLRDVLGQLATILPILIGPLGAIAKLIGSLPPDVQGTVTTFVAFAVVAGALGGKLALLGGVLFKGASLATQFAGGIVKGSSALANNASFAAKAGGALRGAASAINSGVLASSRMVVSLSSQAGAWLLTTTRTVASTVATKAATVAQKAMAVAIRLVNAAMNMNPIAKIVLLISGLIAIVVLAYKKNETFRKIIDAVWAGIQKAIKFAVDNVIKPVLRWLYEFIMGSLVPKFQFLYYGVIRPVMQRIGEVIKTSIDKVKTTFTTLKTIITETIPNAFRTGVSAIGRFWGKVQEVAKKPVSFIVNTVYNKGIATVWNWVADKTGLGRINYIQGFAGGGVLPGYSRKDNQLIAARSGESIFVPEFTKAVGSDWVTSMNAIASRGGPRAVAKALTGDGMGIPAFQNGGIVGAVQGFFAKAKDFFVNGFIKAAKGVLNPIINIARNTIGGTPFGKLLVGAVDRIVNGVLTTFKPYEAELGGGGATGVVKAAVRYLGQGDRGRDNDNKFNDRWGYPAGTPWCANFVSTAIADAKAGKRYAGYPTAAVYGYWSRMKKVGLGNARPGDLAVHGGPSTHINMVERKLGGNGYTTIGGNEGPYVRRATRSSAYSILRPSFERGGIFDKKVFQQRNEDKTDRHNPMREFMAGELRPFKFDNGGVLEPGMLGVNKTREPEYVFTRKQMASGFEPKVEVVVHVDPITGKSTYEVLKKYKRANGGRSLDL